MHTTNFKKSWSRSLKLTLISTCLCVFINITCFYMYFIYTRNNITNIKSFHELLLVKQFKHSKLTLLSSNLEETLHKTFDLLQIRRNKVQTKVKMVCKCNFYTPSLTLLSSSFAFLCTTFAPCKICVNLIFREVKSL